MTDETALAFRQPLARAEATAGPDPLDRISVRDYVRDVDIGAFQSERGVTQRLRFNVVLEVAATAAAETDDVDQVLSYDTITDAIEEELETERMNLLETFAERIAERCLADRRAIRVFVRIEKLDRIPGALGVEISRRRRDMEGSVVQPLAPARAIAAEDHSPIVIYLPSDVLNGPLIGDWLDAIDALDHPAIVALEPISFDLPEASPMVQRRIGLLAVEQNCWHLASKDPRCVVVESRTELEWAAKQGQMSVWAPSKIVLDAVHRPDVDARQPRRLAEWFAGEIGALALIEIGPERDAQDDETRLFNVSADVPGQLAEVAARI